MSTAVEILRFAGHHIAFNIRAAMEYRWAFLMEVTFMALNDLIFLLYWWILYGQIGDVGGWERSDTFELFGLVALSFGLVATFFGNAFRISALVVDGELDVYLLLPRDPLGHLLVGRTMASGIGDILFGLITLALMARPGDGRLLVLPLLACFSAMILTSVLVMVHSLTFVLGNAEALSRLVTEAMVSLGMYPETIYRGAVRYLMFLGLPVAFFAHVPARLLKDPSPELLLYLGLFAVLISILAAMTFRTGLRFYESGNRIGMRI